MKNRFLTSAMAGALALNFAACGGGDSLGPQIQLTDAQTEDMLDALDAIGAFDVGFSVASAGMRNPDIALYTLTYDESDTCTDGGSMRIQGTVSGADDGSNDNANLTISFTNCAGRSSSNTLWTFNGAPNLKFMFTYSENASTGAWTESGSVTGAISASSSMGSGTCAFNVTITGSGNNTSGSTSVTGTVCGKPYSEIDTY